MLASGLNQIIDFAPAAWALMAGAVLLGALVKGVFGIGFPFIAMPLMAIVAGVPTAIALLAVPIVVANLFQVWQEGLDGVPTRFWTLILALIPGTWLGTELLLLLEPRILLLIMGVSIIVFCGLQLSRLPIRIPRSAEPWLAPIVGFTSGILGGLTAFFGAPMMIFMLSIEMRRDQFVATIGLIYLFCGLFLLGSLALRGLIAFDSALAGMVLCAPMALGMVGGARIRRMLPAESFVPAVLVLLLMIGLGVVGRAL